MTNMLLSLKSAVLGKDTDLRIIVPDNIKSARVLYLLHGLSDNQNAWQRYTSIERYAREYNYFVIMPDADKSFYTDMKYGLPYYTYITAELPEYLESIFKINHVRKNTFIAGLSMGGYGAMKIVLKNPDKYIGAASFSGVLDVATSFDRNEFIRKITYNIIGDASVKNTDNDLFYLLDSYKHFDREKPFLYFACGTEDEFIVDNRKFNEKIMAYGFNHIYEEAPGGHSWDFWDIHVKRAIEYFNEIK